MPYHGEDDPSLPENVKKLPSVKRRAFVHAFNSAMQQHGDESRAFAIAHAAANHAGESEEAMEEPNLEEAELTQKAVNDLPDSAFAYIEPGGEKDDDGKTVPRGLRHFPIHDEAHVRNALARLSQSPFGDKARAKVVAAAKHMGIGEPAEESTKPLRTNLLSEVINLSEGAWNGEEKTVQVTLIKPGWSNNKRYYSPEVLKKAIPAFEGMRAFANHPSKSDEKDRPERDVRDIAGYYEGIRAAEDGSLKGTMHIVGKTGEDLWPLIVETIKKKPDLIGASILAVGKVTEGEREGQKGQVVEEILPARSNSVDIVTLAAAGGRFERLAAADNLTGELLNLLEFEEWRDARPDFVKKLREEMKTARQTEAVEQRDTEIAQLKEAVAVKEERLREQEAEVISLRQEKAQREADALALAKLDESGLPEVIWEHVKPELLHKTAEEMDRILEREIAKLKATGALKPKAKGLGQEGNIEEQLRDAKQTALNEILGLREDVSPVRPGETVWDYQRRRQEGRDNDGEKET